MFSFNKWLKRINEWKNKSEEFIFTKANHVPTEGLFNWINGLNNVWLKMNLKRLWRLVIYVWGNDSLRGEINGYVPYWR